MAGMHSCLTLRACLAAVGCAAALVLPRSVSASDWGASDQPNLHLELDSAQPLDVERLGKAARNVGQFGVTLVPHHDAESYDALIFYTVWKLLQK